MEQSWHKQTCNPGKSWVVFLEVFVVTYVQGDIFKSPAQVLTNAVNCVGVMVKGVALEFKKRYKGLFEDGITNMVFGDKNFIDGFKFGFLGSLAAGLGLQFGNFLSSFSGIGAGLTSRFLSTSLGAISGGAAFQALNPNLDVNELIGHLFVGSFGGQFGRYLSMANSLRKQIENPKEALVPVITEVFGL
jgi:hypothetical protein